MVEKLWTPSGSAITSAKLTFKSSCKPWVSRSTNSSPSFSIFSLLAFILAFMASLSVAAPFIFEKLSEVQPILDCIFSKQFGPFGSVFSGVGWTGDSLREFF